MPSSAPGCATFTPAQVLSVGCCPISPLSLGVSALHHVVHHVCATNNFIGVFGALFLFMENFLEVLQKIDNKVGVSREKLFVGLMPHYT